MRCCSNEESHEENVLNLYYNARKLDHRKLTKLRLPRRWYVEVMVAYVRRIDL